MTTLYVGKGGNDGNNGQSWALRKLTLNGAEDIPVVSGDVIYVGPGAYRELLTCDVSGGNTYNTGTVSVTNGSDQVTGNGTAWVANVGADYLFHVRYYASGNDMVTDGTNNVTAAGGNFQAAMEGLPIQINTKGAYVIDTVNAANDVDISDPNGLGWPAAGAGLTYSVMSGEGHYEIESVDDNTTITLKQNWQGRTLTGLSYLTFEPITYIADVTGESTDGVGGVVRITGSDNDQTATRAYGIDVNQRDYRVFRGFTLDTFTSYPIYADILDHLVIEDFTLAFGGQGIYLDGAVTCVSIRRIATYGIPSQSIYINQSGAYDDAGHVIENARMVSETYCVRSNYVGGFTVRNCLLYGGGLRVGQALTVGQTVWVSNSVITAGNTGLQAIATGEITENYNAFFQNSTDRNNVATGGNSVAYTPVFLSPVLYAGEDHRSGYRFPPPLMGELSEWSQLNLTGIDERDVDLFGIPRPATASKCSWGAHQFMDMELEDTTVQAGSYARVLNDAGAVLVRRVPCTNVETTVTLYMRYEGNYAGNLPRMTIKQPGAADRHTVMVAAANTWEQLSDTFTPNASPGYFEVWAESRNTDGANDKVFYDTLEIS